MHFIIIIIVWPCYLILLQFSFFVTASALMIVELLFLLFIHNNIKYLNKHFSFLISYIHNNNKNNFTVMYVIFIVINKMPLSHVQVLAFFIIFIYADAINACLFRKFQNQQHSSEYENEKSYKAYNCL